MAFSNPRPNPGRTARWRALERGAGARTTSTDTQIAEPAAEPQPLSDIGALLDGLADLEPELANIFDLNFSCRLCVVQTTALRGVSERTVQRRWAKGRLLLYRSRGASA